MSAEIRPVAALISRFRRQRPLRGGSLIVTIFGDAIAPRGGAVALSSLIELAQPFGLGERLVRTSVARLVDEQWLERRREGRLSEYALSPVGRERFAAATQRIYARPDGTWSGRWTLVLLVGVRGPQRQALREALQRAGFGEPMPGVMLRAVTAERSARGLAAELHALGHEQAARTIAAANGSSSALVVLDAEGLGADDRRDRAVAPTSPPRLVAAGWNLEALAASYRRFLRHFEPLLRISREQYEGARLSAFVARTLLVHEYRRVQLRDPMLPPSLLPDDWPGTAAYELCRAVYARVLPAAERHLSVTATRISGAGLPSPDRALWNRFGAAPVADDRIAHAAPDDQASKPSESRI